MKTQVPTSAEIIDNVITTCSNQTHTSCDLLSHDANRYGYRRCVQYQVLDQNVTPQEIYETLAVHEVVSIVDANYTPNSQTGDSSTNAAGQFLDENALLGASTLPGNSCGIVKQTVTVTGKTSAIRVNCLLYSSTDVTITDVTSNPSSCSKPTYHCN